MLNEPGGQGKQLVGEGEKDPASQSLHADKPITDAYVPVMQSVQEVASPDEKVPAAQARHDVSVEKRPALQDPHADAPAPE